MNAHNHSVLLTYGNREDIFFLLVPEAVYTWAQKELQCDHFSFEIVYSREAKKRRRKGEI